MAAIGGTPADENGKKPSKATKAGKAAVTTLKWVLIIIGGIVGFIFLAGFILATLHYLNTESLPYVAPAIAAATGWTGGTLA